MHDTNFEKTTESLGGVDVQEQNLCMLMKISWYQFKQRYYNKFRITVILMESSKDIELALEKHKFEQ